MTTYIRYEIATGEIDCCGISSTDVLPFDIPIGYASLEGLGANQTNYVANNIILDYTLNALWSSRANITRYTLRPCRASCPRWSCHALNALCASSPRRSCSTRRALHRAWRTRCTRRACCTRRAYPDGPVGPVAPLIALSIRKSIRGCGVTCRFTLLPS